MQTAALTRAAAQLDVDLSADQCAALRHYVGQLEKWNSSFNLVSRKDIQRIWSRHVLDSLSVLPVLKRYSTGCKPPVQALDVGTGAGLPGIPLAIAEPSLNWLLIDRSPRKTRFLELIVAELELANVRVSCVDLSGGAAAADLMADLVVSRAVGSATELVALAGRQLRQQGTMVLLSGAGAAAQSLSSQASGAAADLDEAFCIVAVEKYQIPGLDRTHEVTIIRRRELN